MRYRKLGKTGLEISAITYGGMALGAKSAAPSDERRTRAIHAALDAGINAIDTAPLYEQGGSEKLIGLALKGRRDRVVLMSKVGLRWDDPRGKILFGNVRKNSRPDSLKWEVDQSLARLGVEYLDLCQIHHPDDETPIADAIGTLLELRRAGKIRELGVSNFSVPQLEQVRAAMGTVPLASVQQELNLIERTAERSILPWVREHQVGFLAYAPLYKGLLTGRVADSKTFSRDDFRGDIPAFQPKNRARINAAIERVARPMATKHGVSVAQLAGAWVLANSGVTSAICGASSAEQAKENAATADLVLTGAELLELRQALEAVKIEGAPPAGLLGQAEKRAKYYARRIKLKLTGG